MEEQLSPLEENINIHGILGDYFNRSDIRWKNPKVTMNVMHYTRDGETRILPLGIQEITFSFDIVQDYENIKTVLETNDTFTIVEVLAPSENLGAQEEEDE